MMSSPGAVLHKEGQLGYRMLVPNTLKKSLGKPLVKRALVSLWEEWKTNICSTGKRL
jgi:hypothetical protein